MKTACERITLNLADWDKPFTLGIDIDEECTAGAVILTQGKGKDWTIVVMIGRELTLKERGMTPPELALHIAYWGLCFLLILLPSCYLTERA